MSWMQGVFPSLRPGESRNGLERRQRARRSSVNGPLSGGSMSTRHDDPRHDSEAIYRSEDYYSDSYYYSNGSYGEEDDVMSVDSVGSLAGAGYNWLFGSTRSSRHRRRRRRHNVLADSGQSSSQVSEDQHSHSDTEADGYKERDVQDFRLEALDPREDIQQAIPTAAKNGVNFANIVQMLQKVQPSARARIERSLTTSSASVARQAARIGNVSSRIVTEFDGVISRCNLNAFILGLLSICIMMIQLELAHAYGESTLTLVLHVLISVLTVGLVAQVLYMYTILVKYEAAVQQLPSASLFNQRQLLWPCVFECFFLIMHWPPIGELMWDNRVLLDSKFNIILFLRIYLFLRVMRDHSAVYQRRRDLVKHGYKSMVLSKFDWKMSLRSHFYRNSQTFALITTAVFFPIISYSTYVVERDSNPNVSTMWESLWLTSVTMTTVGFGDVVPVTTWGKILAMCGAVCGIILTAILIAVITQKLTLSNQQVYAINWLSRNRYFELERSYATQLIQHTWRTYRARCANAFMASKREHRDYLISRSLIRKLHAAKHQRLHYETQSSDYTLDSTFQILEESKVRHNELSERLRDMQQVQRKAFDKLDGISKRLTDRLEHLMESRSSRGK